MILLASVAARAGAAPVESVDALALLEDQQSAAAAAAPAAGAAPAASADAQTTGAPTTGAPDAPGAAAAAGTNPAPAVATVAKFGAKDSWRFSVEGDWINDWDDANYFQGRAGFGWFIFDNVEWDFFLTAGYVWQPGPNAFAGGFDMEIRWHFLQFEKWSIFGSIGGGLLGSTHSVPAGGSEFNFTPNIGAGATFEVADNTRLYVSARWFHISNAGTFAHNPGRDSLSLWLGLSFGL
ncbi:MAG: acyloxyacyl hydrolase [Phycisphaerales bacterium]